MSKANSFLTKYEVLPATTAEQTGTKQSRASSMHMPVIIGLVFFVSMALVGGASAAINTTAITEAISAFTDIMPSIGNMVTAIVPTLLTLGVVGFVMKFWNSILEMITSMVRF